MAAKDDRAPTFGQQQRPQPWFGLSVPRWTLRSLVAVGVLLIALTAWYQLTVVPDLTARHYRVWVAGSDDRLTVYVDDEHGRATISGGINGLSQLIIDRDSLFVLAEDVGAGGLGFEWLEVPNSAFDREVRLPTVGDIGRALSRGAKDCKAPNDDAVFMFSLFLGIDTTAEGTSLCNSSIGAAADDGEDLLVKSSAVRPSALGIIPPFSVGQLADVPDADAVVDALVLLFRCEGWRVDDSSC